MTDQEIMDEFTRLHREILALKDENARLAAALERAGSPVGWGDDYPEDAA